MAEMTRSRRAMRSLGADFIHLPWGFLFQHNHSCNNLLPVIHQKLAARDFRTWALGRGAFQRGTKRAMSDAKWKGGKPQEQYGLVIAWYSTELEKGSFERSAISDRSRLCRRLECLWCPRDRL